MVCRSLSRDIGTTPLTLTMVADWGKVAAQPLQPMCRRRFRQEPEHRPWQSGDGARGTTNVMLKRSGIRFFSYVYTDNVDCFPVLGRDRLLVRPVSECDLRGVHLRLSRCALVYVWFENHQDPSRLCRIVPTPSVCLDPIAPIGVLIPARPGTWNCGRTCRAAVFGRRHAHLVPAKSNQSH
ncbi:hypothetical protein F4801DRAFT_386773 [Xylaria longipes]|nr:hypothetical protein F4801DRAFT_386773 [Xylaria longipes]